MLELLRQEIETLTPADQEHLLAIVYDLKKGRKPVQYYTQFFKELLQQIQPTSIASKPRQKGSAKGKLIIHSQDNEHLEAFQDYMPQ